MSVPVTSLSREQSNKIATLLVQARALKEQEASIEEAKKEKEKEIEALLHEVALENNEPYKAQNENQNGRRDSRYQSTLVPTLSEDGRSVVILEKKSHM